MNDLIFYLLWIIFAGNLAQSFYLISLAKKFKRKRKHQDSITQALENFRENLEDYYYKSEILSETMCEYYLNNKDHIEIKIR
jgi:CII-binding regulator of phage lambda lysogenization HflD